MKKKNLEERQFKIKEYKHKKDIYWMFLHNPLKENHFLVTVPNELLKSIDNLCCVKKQNDSVFVCNRCSDLIYSTDSPDYFGFCPEHYEDVYKIETEEYSIDEYLKLLIDTNKNDAQDIENTLDLAKAFLNQCYYEDFLQTRFLSFKKILEIAKTNTEIYYLGDIYDKNSFKHFIENQSTNENDKDTYIINFISSEYSFANNPLCIECSSLYQKKDSLLNKFNDNVCLATILKMDAKEYLHNIFEFINPLDYNAKEKFQLKRNEYMHLIGSNSTVNYADEKLLAYDFVLKYFETDILPQFYKNAFIYKDNILKDQYNPIVLDFEKLIYTSYDVMAIMNYTILFGNQFLKKLGLFGKYVITSDVSSDFNSIYVDSSTKIVMLPLDDYLEFIENEILFIDETDVLKTIYFHDLVKLGFIKDFDKTISYEMDEDYFNAIKTNPSYTGCFDYEYIELK